MQCPTPLKVKHKNMTEAIRAAVACESLYQCDFDVYRCGNHWHITDITKKRRKIIHKVLDK